MFGNVQIARAGPATLLSPPVIKPMTDSATGMTPEYGMSWSETMKGDATVAALEHVANDESGFRRTQAASWDPFEVWLTRIKQPRDNAANRLRPTR